ncbi:hypothetical protein ILYODFUR_038975 [Ilyodon furcidens]|uniref:Secreted protein n=1 Tax=Ilyodon furcidens TaxID=33524 RepID=A0ABV0V9Q3_9TELE
MFFLITCLPVSLVHTPLPSAYKLSIVHCSPLVPYVINPCYLPEFCCGLFSVLPPELVLPAFCKSTFSFIIKLHLLTMRPPRHVLHPGPASKPTTLTLFV